MRQLPRQSSKSIDLRGRNGDKARDESEEIKISCICCWEDSPDGLEWILLTNMPIFKEKDALEKIDWYKARWLIEEYHKCLKTGCAIEKRQLKSAHALLALLGILGIIATKLLEIKFLARKYSNGLAEKSYSINPIKNYSFSL